MIKSYWVPTSLQSDRSASWADEEETELLANDSGVSCSAGWVRKGLVTANPVAGVDKPGPVRGESGSCPMPRSGSFARPPGPDQLRRSPVASPTLQGVQTPETLNRHRMKVQWQVKSMPIASWGLNWFYSRSKTRAVLPIRWRRGAIGRPVAR
jgi:hypothetical protein